MKKELTDIGRINPVDENDEQREIRNAFNDLRNALKGLKGSTDELVDEFAQLNQFAKANNGTIPDVNEILRTIFDGDDS